jgi:hypothetical protein
MELEPIDPSPFFYKYPPAASAIDRVIEAA